MMEEKLDLMGKVKRAVRSSRAVVGVVVGVMVVVISLVLLGYVVKKADKIGEARRRGTTSAGNSRELWEIEPWVSPEDGWFVNGDIYVEGKAVFGDEAYQGDITVTRKGNRVKDPGGKTVFAPGEASLEELIDRDLTGGCGVEGGCVSVIVHYIQEDGSIVNERYPR